MNKVTKILGIIIITALLLGRGVTATVVAASEVAVSIDAPAQAAPGSDFTANVSISEVANFDAGNYDVSFDASVLRLDNVTSGLIGSTTIPVDVYNEISTGTWRIVQNVPGLAGASGSGYLAILHFHVIASADDREIINLSNGVLSDNTASEITATWVGDSVEIAVATPEETAPSIVPASPSEENAPPSVTVLSPEDTAPPTALNPAPKAGVPNESSSPPEKPINWLVLWGIIGGVILTGILVLSVALRRTY